jgi:hypothetical protein
MFIENRVYIYIHIFIFIYMYICINMYKYIYIYLTLIGQESNLLNTLPHQHPIYFHIYA